MVLIVLLLVFGASGCVVTQSTAPGPGSGSGSGLASGPGSAGAGYPCSYFHGDGCYYYVSNGTAIPCDVVDDPFTLNYCHNTSGDYYEYYEGTTILCTDAECDNSTSNVAVSPPQLCKPAGKSVYANLANGGQAWEVVNQQEDQNTTRQPITTRFISTSASTVTTSVSADLTVNVDALLGTIFVSVHAELNASVTKTASTVVGNEVTVTAPAGATAYGIYGVRVQISSGHLYQTNSCGAETTNYGSVKAYVPIASGWCVWLSGQTPCRVVSGS
jgi:hypothetical protein